jgi:phosphopantetheine adenylyltransferase
MDMVLQHTAMKLAVSIINHLTVTATRRRVTLLVRGVRSVCGWDAGLMLGSVVRQAKDHYRPLPLQTL